MESISPYPWTWGYQMLLLHQNLSFSYSTYLQHIWMKIPVILFLFKYFPPSNFQIAKNRVLDDCQVVGDSITLFASDLNNFLYRQIEEQLN